MKQNWILGGYSAEFSLTKQLPPELLSATLHSLLHVVRDIIPSPHSVTEFNNLKGRGREDMLLSGLPAAQGEELLTVGGAIATESKGDSFVWTPFRTSLLTHFAHFQGSSQIAHTVQERRSESIPSWLPWWLLGAAAPLRVEYARFGFEHFTSRFRVTQFGFMPVVSDSLLLDLTNEEIALRLTTDQPTLKRCNPFETVALFKRVAISLRSTLGISLSDQFTEELELAGSWKKDS
jgi:hypothetical protein